MEGEVNINLASRLAAEGFPKDEDEAREVFLEFEQDLEEWFSLALKGRVGSRSDEPSAVQDALAWVWRSRNRVHPENDGHLWRIARAVTLHRARTRGTGEWLRAWFGRDGGEIARGYPIWSAHIYARWKREAQQSVVTSPVKR